MIEVFKKNLIWFIITILIIIIYGLVIIFLTSPISEYSIEKAGQFGDSFGIINTLFSGSAFVSILITIYLQQQEMREIKKETKKQNFENTFFKMLDLYNNVVKDLSLERPKNTIDFFPDGTEKFEYVEYEILGKKLCMGEKDYYGKEVIIKLLEIFNLYKKIINKQTTLKTSKGIYEDFHSSFENNIGHYFGTIYQILKFIDKSNIEEDKQDYSNLFRAQFSKDELELLFYHSTSKISKRKFTPLLIKYEFFEHINIEVLDERAIKLIIKLTNELNNEYPLNKIFGQNERSKEKVNQIFKVN